ncbi:hypothetical protein A2757_01680 [Candidatus Giovannonibacteria bacterium RIFCSPHIGHO2_01_FULL_48_47]|nr:MAG: hypothetical protein A2757_01680 [Candidatus Giovannonibacteria bacterium RIFCSPHIGHO2_01_FULL_48_47]OGF88750.1 MAG: hypothetical protein A3B26_02965 [Candidatus Giovannonibacteria bacterium RIFCSPLOWO2_01_FULL_48_47]OGF94475.1 MAG: hypothetical protein A2433_00500 [Candidatus Giovannonibacteria bacterium RIFOXYC1_FULL_48_8]OGF96129.1 MAG: hypothetical protein A2613_00990 [Candidatus Giovannonibacteria bacterium RIFOXYD1_FULL_48_21]HBT81347.1 hypothetical protein [Candidatus Giovannonib
MKTKTVLAILSALFFAASPLAGVGVTLASCTPHTVTIVSDTANNTVAAGGAPAVAVTPHAAWTAVISGSTTWIWETGPTSADEVVAFERNFTVVGAVLSAQLDIATDNSYKVFIDGVEVGADASAINFTLATQDVYNLTAAVTPGTHTLRVEVKNHGTFNASSNPAGLLYKLVVESEKCEGDITVTNNNSAYVKNEVDVSASTGGNDANGGSGSAAGNGGNVQSSNSGNTGGNGGNGGDGGDGGVILTGNAFAKSKIVNKVNTNVTRVDPCDCDVDDVTVTNNNSAKVKNYVEVKAKTGYNDANGGNAGCGCEGGGDGGNVTNSNSGNAGGDGGNAGDGGDGGVIVTGHAFAKSKILNRVNTNITRIP